MTNESIKSALESILFVWGDPLDVKTAADLFNVPAADMLHILRELAEDYETRRSGLRIREADKAFQLCTNPENDDYITKLVTQSRKNACPRQRWRCWRSSHISSPSPRPRSTRCAASRATGCWRPS